MAATFTNAAVHVGDTATVVYAASATSVVIGLNLSNVTGAALPCSVFLRQPTGDSYLAKNLRLNSGENKDIVSSKVTLKSGDQIMAVTPVANGFDITASILQGVA